MATDYEKKYKEALERAKKMMESKRKVVVEKQALETIFPELAESEDERIRRRLCDYFSSIDKAWIHKDITCIDILRWLEKQKEQKPAEVDESTKRLNDNWMKQHFDEYTEQKPVECELEDAFKYYTDAGITISCGDIVAKPKEQKPAEWSEDDENVYKTIMDDFNGITPMSKAYKLKAAKWLKSLRPSWKPSEEHLSALLAVFNDPNNIGSQTCQLALTDLYEQLKKL